MERISTVIKTYNVSADTLFEFLIANGYEGNLALTTKINDKYLVLIDKEFKSDLEEKSKANSIEIPQTEQDKLLKEIQSLKMHQTKRIAVHAGKNISYRDIFGPCFWGCREIHCIDPYIRERHQFDNVKQLTHLIKEFSSNSINFYLTTCFDTRQPQTKTFIEQNLNLLRSSVYHQYQEAFSQNPVAFNMEFTVEEDKFYHDRHIYIDNRYIIDLSRGLDIFESYSNQSTLITKNCTVFITRGT